MPAGLRTVKTFVFGAHDLDSEICLLALQAKAMVLFEYATRAANFTATGEYTFHKNLSKVLTSDPQALAICLRRCCRLINASTSSNSHCLRYPPRTRNMPA